MSLENKTAGARKFSGKKKGRKINTRRLQYGTLSIVLTVVFIAVILLANAGVTYLTDRFSLKADISVAGYYEISEQTETMLKNLTEPVTCYILLSETDVANSQYYSISAEFLNRYVTLSNGMFNVEYVDVYKNPDFMSQFEDAGSISTGSFVMKTDKRYRVCSLYDLYEISNTYDDYGNVQTSYVSGFDADEQFASMLHYVTTGQLPTVGFITGHNETYTDGFKEIFESNNYEVYEINLMLEDIPNGTDMIVISAPYTDYTDDEIEKLDTYFLKEFGKGMVFMALDATEMPNLNAYFEEWGVRFEQEMVLDSKRALTMPAFVAPYIQNTDMNTDLERGENAILCTPYARPITVLWDERSARSVSVELKTADSAYAKPYSNDDINSTFEQEDGDRVGPFPVAVVSQYWEWINNRSYTAQILFCGTPYIAEDTMLSTKNLHNKQFLTNAISYLTPSTDAVSLTARDMTSSEMTILTEQATAILIALVVVLPVIVMALGVVIWLKRRNK